MPEVKLDPRGEVVEILEVVDDTEVDVLLGEGDKAAPAPAPAEAKVEQPAGATAEVALHGAVETVVTVGVPDPEGVMEILADEAAPAEAKVQVEEPAAPAEPEPAAAEPEAATAPAAEEPEKASE